MNITHRRRVTIWCIAGALILAGAIWLLFFMKPKEAPAALPVVGVEPVECADVNIYGEYVGRIRAQ